MRLHGLAELAEPNLGVGMGVGDDVGVVDAREGDHEHVLEEAGGTDGEGPFGDGREAREPLRQGLAQRRFEEARAHRALAFFAERLVEGEGPEGVRIRGSARTRRCRRRRCAES